MRKFVVCGWVESQTMTAAFRQYGIFVYFDRVFFSFVCSITLLLHRESAKNISMVCATYLIDYYTHTHLPPTLCVSRLMCAAAVAAAAAARVGCENENYIVEHEERLIAKRHQSGTIGGATA